MTGIGKLVATLTRARRHTPVGRITADPNPIPDASPARLGATRLSWTAPGAETVEVRIDAPDGPLLSRSGPSGDERTGPWVRDGMMFFLQDVSGGPGLGPANTLATVRVRVTSPEEEGASVPRRFIRRIRTRLASRGAILLYHRVTELAADRRSLAVSPAHFAEHLEVLRRFGHPMRIAQVGRRLRDGNLPRRAIAVTFDDGYADNLEQAKPLLERYDVPATIFVTTGVGGRREFYWDELDRLLLQPGRLPSELRLSIARVDYAWSLEGDASYGDEAWDRDRSWRPWHSSVPTARHALYRDLDRLLRGLPGEGREEVLASLRAWASVGSEGRTTHRPLSRAEIAHLADSSLIEIGAHTVSHADLALQPNPSQREEISRSKAFLQELLDRSVTSFAYPYGSYNAGTVAAVRDAGFACACAALPDVVDRSTDHFELPRLPVGNWDGETFARRLADLLEP